MNNRKGSNAYESDSYDIFDELKEIVAPKVEAPSEPGTTEPEAGEPPESIDIIDRDGSRYGYPYSLKQSVSCSADEDVVKVRFGRTLVRLSGRNLKPLYQTLYADEVALIEAIDPIHDTYALGSWAVYAIEIEE